jgi:hypothetical protein
MSQIDVKKLSDELEKIMTLLKKSGLIDDSVDIKKTASLVAERLTKEGVKFTVEQVTTHQETRQLLGLACIAANRKDNLDYISLFKNTLDLADKDELNRIFNKILKPVLDNKNPENKKILEDRLEQLALLLTKLRKEHQEPAAKFVLAMQILQPDSPEARQRREQRIADYGVDTQNPGAVFEVLQAVVAGDQMGRQDLSTSGDNFKGKENSPNTDSGDFLGIHATAALASLMTAVIDTQTEINLVSSLKDAGASLYETPRLTH